MLHGEVSKEIFSNMYPGYLPEELFISYVTNGFILPGLLPNGRRCMRGSSVRIRDPSLDKKCFEEIYKVPDEESGRSGKP